MTRMLSHFPSRRDVVRGLGGAGLGLGFGGLADPGEARKKRQRKRKKHKKQQVSFNAFGCVDVGKFCQNNEQCCSGICTGNTGKKRCQAHDTGGCQLADDTCLHEGSVLCPVDANDANKALAFCFQTTGKASFCGIQMGDQCVDCAKDADCVADFGPGAACVICARFCADSNHTTCIRAELPT